MNDGWDAYGIDLSEKMVDHARDLLSNEGADRTRIVQGRLDNLSFYADRSFDVVISLGVLGYIDPETEKNVYAEIHRVLKPNGIFLVEHTNGLFDLLTFNRFTVDFYRREIISRFIDDSEEQQIIAS